MVGVVTECQLVPEFRLSHSYCISRASPPFFFSIDNRVKIIMVRLRTLMTAYKKILINLVPGHGVYVLSDNQTQRSP